MLGVVVNRVPLKGPGAHEYGYYEYVAETGPPTRSGRLADRKGRAHQHARRATPAPGGAGTPGSEGPPPPPPPVGDRGFPAAVPSGPARSFDDVVVPRKK